MEKSPRGLCRQDHLFRSPLANTLWLAITPHIRRQDRLVAFIDEIANGLADEVV